LAAPTYPPAAPGLPVAGNDVAAAQKQTTGKTLIHPLICENFKGINALGDAFK